MRTIVTICPLSGRLLRDAGSVISDPSDIKRPLPKSVGGSYPVAIIYGGEESGFKIVFAL